MKRRIKRIGALGACCLLLAGLAGCSPSPAAVTVDGSQADAAELAFYLEYNRLNLAAEQGDETGEYDEETTQMVKQQALEQIVTAEIVLAKCKEFDLKLTYDEKDQLKENKKELSESHGGKAGYLAYLNENAMADRVYDKFQTNALYYDKLYDYLVGPGGEYDFTDVELRQFFADHYAQVQYIRFSMTDMEGDPLDQAEGRRAMERAQQVMAQAQAPGADFTQLVESYNDDPYMSDNPGGIIVAASQCAASPQFAELFQLSENQIGGVYTGIDGYYVVKRLPVSAAYFDENQDSILQEARDGKFNQLLDQWKAEAEVKTTGVFDKMTLSNLWDYVK